MTNKTPKTIEEKILEEFEENFPSDDIRDDMSSNELAYYGQLRDIKSFLSSSLTSLREQIAKEDVKWCEAHRKEMDCGDWEATKNWEEAHPDKVAEMESYNKALQDVVTYKQGKIIK